MENNGLMAKLRRDAIFGRIADRTYQILRDCEKRKNIEYLLRILNLIENDEWCKFGSPISYEELLEYKGYCERIKDNKELDKNEENKFERCTIILKNHFYSRYLIGDYSSKT